MSESTGPQMDDRGPGFRAFIIVLFVITVLAISLRFWSRAITPIQGKAHRFWWDDWLALAAVPLILSLFAICFILVELGLGRHIWTLDPLDLTLALKLLFAAHFLWDVALYLAKESALLFFRRIFPRNNSTRIFNFALTATHVLNTSWLIGIVIGALLRCSRVDLNWNPMLPGKCGSLQGAWLGTAIPSLVIDFIILLLPMPTIWGLKTSKPRKLALTVIFTLGYSVCVVTIGRLVTISISGNVLENDLTYDGIPALYWLAADTPLTLLSICLPAMITLYNNIVNSFVSPATTKLSSRFYSRTTGRGYSNRIGDSVSPKDFHEINPAGNSSSEKLYEHTSAVSQNSYPMDNIRGNNISGRNSEPYSVQVNAGQRLDARSKLEIPGRTIQVDRGFEVHRL